MSGNFLEVPEKFAGKDNRVGEGSSVQKMTL